MKLVNLQNNIVFIFNEDITSSFKTDPVELKIADIFSEKNPKPIITKIPNQVMIFIPEIQFSLISSGPSLIVTDQTINEFAKKNSNQLLNLSHSVVKDILKKTTSYYGYNFTYDLEEIDNKEAENKIKSYFFNDKVSELGELNYILPSYSIKVGGADITISFSHQYKDVSRTSYTLRVGVNFHFEGSIPELTKLSEDYLKAEGYVSEQLKSIFK